MQVWRARLRETGEEIAVKLLDLENINCSLVNSLYTNLNTQLTSRVP